VRPHWSGQQREAVRCIRVSPGVACLRTTSREGPSKLSRPPADPSRPGHWHRSRRNPPTRIRICPGRIGAIVQVRRLRRSSSLRVGPPGRPWTASESASAGVLPGLPVRDPLKLANRIFTRKACRNARKTSTSSVFWAILVLHPKVEILVCMHTR
jgi:hypothetical protein